MISNVKYLSFILLLVLTACKSGPAASQEQNGKQDTVKVFNLPDIPVVLNTVSQRADYMVKHYWDRFDCRTGLGGLLRFVGTCALVRRANCHKRDDRPGREKQKDAGLLCGTGR